MNKRYKITLFLILITYTINAQDVLGKWKTIDDETGNIESIVEIYNIDGKVYGKILTLIDPKSKGMLCEKCTGINKNKPIEGLVVIKELTKFGDEYKGGTIFDPKNGKKYKCKIWIDSDNKDVLNVRGYVSLFYRTQNWYRID